MKKLVERTRKMKIGDPFAEDTTVGATISQEQGEKVLKYIELAKTEVSACLRLIEPLHEKACLQGFRPGPIKSGLNHRKLLEA